MWFLIKEFCISAYYWFIIFIFYKICRSLWRLVKPDQLLKAMKIVEITNHQECKKACMTIRSHCEKLSALGFDCEWITLNGIQLPVALLQLATVNGLCYLFRVNVLREIPQELKEILSDPQIIKLGITPLHDSKLLRKDYNAEVTSTLDLRYLYPEGGGLAAMAASEIGITLNKHWSLSCSNWEAYKLSDEQKDYAAKDAFVAIEIFKKWLRTRDKTTDFYTEISRFLDINFSPKSIKSPYEASRGKLIPESLSFESKKSAKSSFITRKSPLYHNCFMHAPDGELLCSCDRKKAEWYVERGLATVMPGEPYSIKLLFEPAARSGDTSGGRFYQHLKQNCCVVCGESNSYLKHNVVPREYRKHFPSFMKDHQSHDIVLMCVSCHHLASRHNEVLRKDLAVLCNAPITAPKVINSEPLQEVKISAKALISAGSLMPIAKRRYLENILKDYYEVDVITPEVLNISANLDCKSYHKNDESHGLRVVQYFTQEMNGLRRLEVMWREHFIKTMNPQHLPALWSVHHNHN